MSQIKEKLESFAKFLKKASRSPKLKSPRLLIWCNFHFFSRFPKQKMFFSHVLVGSPGKIVESVGDYYRMLAVALRFLPDEMMDGRDDN